MSTSNTAEHAQTGKADHSNGKSSHIPGEPELWIFILGDMVVFGVFFALWSITRLQQPEVFSAGSSHVNQLTGLINTLILITSSAFVASGLQHILAANAARARRSFITALVLGLSFIALKFLEYTQAIKAGADVEASRFDMYYFVFTGIHLMHVLIGVALLLLVVRRCRLPDEPGTDIVFIESVSVYWHLVDVLWIVLFLLIYVL